VGDRPGEATLHVSRGDPEISTFEIDKWQSGRFAGFSWEDRITVSMTTIDRLIDEHGEPALVKIDVEGHEPLVLAGLGRPLRWVSFEFSRDYLDDARRCVDRLASLGPTIFNATTYRRWRPLLDEWTDGDKLLQRLAGEKSGPLFGDIHARMAPCHQTAASCSNNAS
jgi:hypothetical protein